MASRSANKKAAEMLEEVRKLVGEPLRIALEQSEAMCTNLQQLIVTHEIEMSKLNNELANMEVWQEQAEVAEKEAQDLRLRLLTMKDAEEMAALAVEESARFRDLVESLQGDKSQLEEHNNLLLLRNAEMAEENAGLLDHISTLAEPKMNEPSGKKPEMPEAPPPQPAFDMKDR